MNDSKLSLTLPAHHELAQDRDHLEELGRSNFRSRASQLLESEFSHCWTIREGRCGDRLELKVVVANDFLEKFRLRVSELGFAVDNGDDSSAEAAGRKN